MINIAVIGAGLLGSRHLQALALIDRAASIQVVDPFPASLEKAGKLFSEVSGNGNVTKVRYFKNISLIDNDLDVVVVATNADVRREVVNDLLSQKKVRYLILEKILFQKMEDYAFINSLMDQKGVKAWVNCPRRMWPFYREVRDKMRGAQRVDYNVTGSNYGLGCNSIHFLDCMAYLTGQSGFSLYTDQLDNRTVPARRPEFFEFTGTIYGSTKGGCRVSITSYSGGNAPVLVHIASDSFRCIVDEGKGRAWISTSDDGWNWVEESFIVPYQSRLTHLAVQQILDTGDCELTAYKESWEIHLPLIEALTSHLQKQTSEEIKICPIT